MEKEFKIFKQVQDQTENKTVLKQFIHEDIVNNIGDLDDIIVRLSDEFK